MISISNKKLVFLGFGLSLLLIPFIDYLQFIIILTLFILSWRVISEKYLLPFSIVLFLLITSDIDERLRIALNFGAIVLLAFYFFKEYGIEIVRYPPVPVEIKNLILLVFASMIFSSLLSNDLPSTLNWTLRQAIFFILIYTMYGFIRNEADIKKALISLSIVGLVLALAIIYNFSQSSTALYILQTQGFLSEGGYFGNVAAAGGIFAVSIPITLYFFLTVDSSDRPRRYFVLFLLFIQGSALILTNSRAAILAAAVSILFIIFVLNRKYIKYLVVSGISFALILLLLFPGIIELISVYLRFERVFENSRYQLWEIAARMIENNWLAGVGPGEFKNYIYKYIPAMIGSWQEQQIAWIYDNAGLGHTHNFLLFKFSELGLPGLVTSIALPIVFFRTGNNLMKGAKNHSPKIYILALCLTGAGLGLFVRSIFESTGLLSYGWITRDLPFWLIFSIIVYYYDSFVPRKK